MSRESRTDRMTLPIWRVATNCTVTHVFDAVLLARRKSDVGAFTACGKYMRGPSFDEDRDAKKCRTCAEAMLNSRHAGSQ